MNERTLANQRAFPCQKPAAYTSLVATSGVSLLRCSTAGTARNGHSFPFSLLPTELKSTGTAHHFSFLLNSTDYRILRMDEDHDRMYVGSKDYILSLDLNDINKEPLIVRNLPRRQQ